MSLEQAITENTKVLVELSAKMDVTINLLKSEQVADVGETPKVPQKGTAATKEPKKEDKKIDTSNTPATDTVKQEDLSSLVLKLAKQNRERVVAILTSYGASRVSEVPSDKVDEVKKAIKLELSKSDPLNKNPEDLAA
ncbi:hypothetical protein PT276_08060 [Orbaceae bacterium ESL0721]|nr:hypothetical protein [Orbaceae bacterium ESL0721]